MPRNGAGVYNLVNNTWYPPVNGVLAQSTDWQTFIEDVGSALTQSVSKDGQTPMTGNLPMGNNKITGLANGTAVTDAAAFGQVARYVGNCKLSKSGANLILLPVNGNQLTINGALQTVPAAGVTLSPTGVAGTLYYIYAYMVGAVMTLEASTTGHSQDVTTGVEIKTGDATRTLVGMARPIAGPAWQSSGNQQFVASWFNRGTVTVTGAFTANRNYPNAFYGEPNSEIRNEFLIWAGQVADLRISGCVANTVAAYVNASIAVDSSTVPVDTFASGLTAVNGQFPIACSFAYQGLSEGYHFSTLVGLTSTGTAVFVGSGSAGTRSTLNTVITG